jgi:hypothetical protein
MVAFRLAQTIALNAHDAGRALDHFLADTRHGPISAITLPGECLVRLIRRHDRPDRLECVMTWEPAMAGGCSFLGSLYVIECGRGSLALVLDGLPEFHDRAQLEDERLGSECAEAMGRAVLERIASELSTRSARLGAPSRKLTAHIMQHSMGNVSPLRHAAGAKNARSA